MGLAALGTVGLLAISVTLAAGWIAKAALSTNSHIYASAPGGPGSLTLAGRDAEVAVVATPADAPDASFETRWAQALIPASQSASAMPLLRQDAIQVAADVPLPAPRPNVPAPEVLAQSAPALPKVVELAPVPAPTPPPKPAPAAPQVAMLAPAPAPQPRPPRVPDRLASLPGPGSRTAVYDIAAHTVYLPDGEKLEAHSGLGDKLDDPRYVKVRMRGPTPPNVYDLTLREEIFHGVRAIRLNPVDDDAMYGRAGMLAHTYMLGPNGQSNGCVSFKDYSKFLRAFLDGEVQRLVVVAHLGNAPVPVARVDHGRADRYAFNNR